MATITYERSTITCKDDSGATGKRGTLSIDEQSWEAVERGDGYKYLRPGDFDCEMANMTSGAHAIRVLGDYSAGRIYIHSANYPSELAGCIAPGTSQIDGGVGNSREAMKQIFTALGGFNLGTKVTLTVKES
jgi:hypothetical protein